MPEPKKTEEEWAQESLRMAEAYAVKLTRDPSGRVILFCIQRACSYLVKFQKEDVERALRLIDTAIRLGTTVTLEDVMQLCGQHSNLGDACAARLVASVQIPRVIFLIKRGLITCIGPRTLKALLDAGANPNSVLGEDNPLRRTLYDAMAPAHRIQRAAMLVAAGADTVHASVPYHHRGMFRQLCDLRALWELYASAVINAESCAAAWFVQRDGDLAIAHRVHALLAEHELLNPQ